MERVALCTCTASDVQLQPLGRRTSNHWASHEHHDAHPAQSEANSTNVRAIKRRFKAKVSPQRKRERERKFSLQTGKTLKGSGFHWVLMDNQQQVTSSPGAQHQWRWMGRWMGGRRFRAADFWRH